MSYGRRNVSVLATVAVAGCAYWCAINLIFGVREPWDAPGYFVLWYPMSLGLAAFCGFLFEDEGWRTGPIVVLAQLPVMLVADGGGGSLLIVGLITLLILSMPAVAISALSAWIKRGIVRRRTRGT